MGKKWKKSELKRRVNRSISISILVLDKSKRREMIIKNIISIIGGTSPEMKGNRVIRYKFSIIYRQIKLNKIGIQTHQSEMF